MGKRTVFAIVFILAVWSSLQAFNLNRYYYQGIGKVANKPLDYWVNLEFDEEDADFNIGDLFKFMGGYKSVKKGETLSITVEVPGSPKATLSSKDNGMTLSGKVVTYDGPVELWLLKVPKKLKKTLLTDSELAPVIASSDGYTCFAVLRPNSGGCLSVTSEFKFSPDNRFSMICDSSAVQDIFKNFDGEYSISNGEIVLQTDKGPALKGIIYEDGNYLTIPVGAKNGMSLTLVLIR